MKNKIKNVLNLKNILNGFLFIGVLIAAACSLTFLIMVLNHMFLQLNNFLESLEITVKNVFELGCDLVELVSLICIFVIAYKMLKEKISKINKM